MSDLKYFQMTLDVVSCDGTQTVEVEAVDLAEAYSKFRRWDNVRMVSDDSEITDTKPDYNGIYESGDKPDILFSEEQSNKIEQLRTELEKVKKELSLKSSVFAYDLEGKAWVREGYKIVPNQR